MYTALMIHLGQVEECFKMKENSTRIYQVVIIILIIILLISGYYNFTSNNTYQSQVDYEFSYPSGWEANGYPDGHDVYIFADNENNWNSQFENYVWSNETNTFQPDFENYCYVYAFWEEKPTGGYLINITMVTVDLNNNLHVYIEKIVPTGGVSQEITMPDVFIQIPKNQFEAEINHVYFFDIELS